MFEARLAQGNLFKKIIEVRAKFVCAKTSFAVCLIFNLLPLFLSSVQAISSLVSEINIEITSSGLTIQAMDSGHVCLLLLELDSSTFDPFRCDKNITLGVQTPR